MAEQEKQSLTVEQLVDTLREQHLMLLRAQDREIGLEQQLNTIKAGHNREDLVRELAEVKSSASFKIGRFVTAPFRLFGYIWNFGIRVFRALLWRVKTRLRQR